MADRYAYLPYLGIFLMACWGVAEWAERRQVTMLWLAIPACAGLLALATVTYVQLRYWSDNITLWSHTVAVTPANFVAEDNLGGALIQAGRIEDALPHFQRAVKINPADPVGTLNVATHEQQAGHLSQAIELYLKVIRLTTDPGLRANALSNLGAAYRRVGDPGLAKASYEAALRFDPENTNAFLGLGVLAQRGGDLVAAANLFSQAIAIHPTDVGYLLLGHALRQTGHPREAQVADQAAQRISSDLDQAERTAEHLLND